jgi:hypothetical protein
MAGTDIYFEKYFQESSIAIWNLIIYVCLNISKCWCIISFSILVTTKTVVPVPNSGNCGPFLVFEIASIEKLPPRKLASNVAPNLKVSYT